MIWEIFLKYHLRSFKPNFKNLNLIHKTLLEQELFKIHLIS